MQALEAAILAYLLNALWQVPLVCAAAWCAARLARPTGPRLEHRVWVAALVLEAILPAFHANLAGLLDQARNLLAALSIGHTVTTQVTVTVGDATTQTASFLTLPPALRATVLALYTATFLFFAIRLLTRVLRTRTLLHQSHPIPLTRDLTITWRRLSFGLMDPIASAEIAVSPAIAGPVTVGIQRFALLVPQGFLESVTPHDLDAVFAHELAHMRRHDFAKNLLYELLALPIAWHPALWLSRTGLSESREMVCDQMAAATEGHQSYAHSLLRLASMLRTPTPANTLHAIGIFDANIFERRIMNLTQRIPEPRPARKLLTLAACTLLAVATCGSALALRVNVGTPAAPHQAAAQQPRIDSGVMAGQIISRVQPVYPAEAKANKDTINGSVILDAIIGKDGSIQNLTVLKSLRPDYDRSALDAVREWKYKPYLLNGDPTEVETTITITYSMGED